MKNSLKFKKMHIFFVGIGGISMSGLAKMSLTLGARVSGSDSANAYLPELSSMGACIYLGHNRLHINKDIDLIVYSGAIPLDNEELLEGANLGIPMLERNDFLGEISKQFEDVIVISGSHGKTTVTSMIGNIFATAHLNPTIHVGGVSVNFKSNTVVGDNKYLIVEGCEYRESFLSLSPTTAVILNIDKDHLDYYKTFDNIKLAFNKFADNSECVFSNDNGVVVHKNINIVDKLWRADKIKITQSGYKYNVYYKDKLFLKIKLNVIGRHNIINSLFAIAVAHKYGISKKHIKKGLSGYLGVKRRNETIGEYFGCPVISDYAHHPEELKKSIDGLRERYVNPLIVFQPHTFSRTATLMSEFVDILSEYNNVIVYSTYPAREKYLNSGSAYTLYRKLKNCSKFYAKDMSSLKSILKDLLLKNSFDIITILGAGDLYDKIKEIL